MRGKKARRELHTRINALSSDEVAEIVKEAHPRARGERLDELARKAVAEAHRIVSPRK